MKHIVVALDGPAASGKSTVAGLVAQRLGLLYFDTGVMYRAVAWAALARGIPIADEGCVVALSEALRIEVTPPTAEDGRQYTVLADGLDITWEIRSDAVNRAVSPVSAYVGVRAALTAQQRRIAAAGGLIMVGRDIGAVVLPDAPLKIYLDASAEERARRRYRETVARGLPADEAAILADLLRRDHIDSTRAAAPLSVAPGAVVIDTTYLSIAAVVERLAALIAATFGPAKPCEDCHG
ncbi:MAG: (d)CMP kinase [Chloroflexota bacterium]